MPLLSYVIVEIPETFNEGISENLFISNDTTKVKINGNSRSISKKHSQDFD